MPQAVSTPPRDEVAFDFVDMAPLVERMLDAFWMDVGDTTVDHASAR